MVNTKYDYKCQIGILKTIKIDANKILISNIIIIIENVSKFALGIRFKT